MNLAKLEEKLIIYWKNQKENILISSVMLAMTFVFLASISSTWQFLLAAATIFVIGFAITGLVLVWIFLRLMCDILYAVRFPTLSIEAAQRHPSIYRLSLFMIRAGLALLIIGAPMLLFSDYLFNKEHTLYSVIIGGVLLILGSILFFEGGRIMRRLRMNTAKQLQLEGQQVDTRPYTDIDLSQLRPWDSGEFWRGPRPPGL